MPTQMSPYQKLTTHSSSATRYARHPASAGPAAADYRSRYVGGPDGAATVAREEECNAHSALPVTR